MEAKIVVCGAREHNLKNINVEIPRNRFVVITGLSGSGKSSLAFDTLYAEGQRRYLESLSSYARQFLERLKKPDVDSISGLSPSLAIDQRAIPRNPRSTVATVTEIYDYLRLLYAKVGEVFCPQCGRRAGQQSLQEIVSQIELVAQGGQVGIFAPLVRGRKGEYHKFFQGILKKGFSRVRVDQKIYDLHQSVKISKTKRHDIEVLVDTTEVVPRNVERVRESLKTAMDLANGVCLVQVVSKMGPRRGSDRKSSASSKEYFFSQKRMCPRCGINFKDLAPNVFSFNSPYGACERCRGIGRLSQVIAHRVIGDPSKPLLKGAINEEIYFSFNQYVIEDLIYELKEHFKFDLSTAYGDLSSEVKEALFWGTGEITGLIQELEDLYYSTSSEKIKREIRKFIREDVCSACRGARLKQESLGVRVQGKNIVEMCSLSIEEVVSFFNSIDFHGKEKVIAEPILKEIRERLRFLDQVGLNYLTLDRSVTTLAGGELQRIRLAAQIGVGLTGVLYVLDEPTIGLHPKDNEKLLGALTRLKDLNNTLIVVEHDEQTMRHADCIIDLGPRAGREGGELMAVGDVKRVSETHESLTGRYLSGQLSIPIPRQRKDYRKAEFIMIKGCAEHNLKQIDVRFPLGCLICVTGVSGSGKSTLVHDILFKAVHNQIWKTDYATGMFRSISNLDRIDRIVSIDQAPIGRTPRSNPATYTDVFTAIRKLFAQTHEARLRSFSHSRFSFNLKGGRCDICRGEGYQRLEMSFLPDVYVLCEACLGKRYNEPTLNVRYRGRNIADVLDSSVGEALEFFSPVPQIRERLQLLDEIGLGYLKLGQPSTTLSGGEAQRIKLASELQKRSTGKTLYILDEPTTGLHAADIANLLKALFRLRDGGNTVIVVEHNLEVVKMADYIIDLGPEGGDKGGEVVGAGSPEEVAMEQSSYTGGYLRKYLHTNEL
ncbi:MAG: excinuclease ABC subunit A [Omnitrophica bacterium RIFCSPLOWO2_12_FULL_50_11]|nr:MAG: excinuclease ABC subunit A [Omnitrophica bacterium RIFCSPLOWO2_12_FULL_50_11]